MASILQVVSTSTLNPSNLSITPLTWVNIPGMTLAITPANTANVVKISCVLTGDRATMSQCYTRILRNGTPVGNGIPPGSQIAAYCRIFEFTTFQSYLYVDNPATTSAVTYQLQCTANGSQTIYFNTDFINSYVGASCLVLEEIG